MFQSNRGRIFAGGGNCARGRDESFKSSEFSKDAGSSLYIGINLAVINFYKEKITYLSKYIQWKNIENTIIYSNHLFVTF